MTQNLLRSLWALCGAQFLPLASGAALCCEPVLFGRYVVVISPVRSGRYFVRYLSYSISVLGARNLSCSAWALLCA